MPKLLKWDFDCGNDLNMVLDCGHKIFQNISASSECPKMTIGEEVECYRCASQLDDSAESGDIIQHQDGSLWRIRHKFVTGGGWMSVENVRLVKGEWVVTPSTIKGIYPKSYKEYEFY